MSKSTNNLIAKIVLFVPIIILCFYIISCDENNNMISMPEPTPLPTPPPDCLDASSNSNILENSIECPTDALVQICNPFSCTFFESDPNSPEFLVSFAPFTCTASSCLDFTCDIGLRDFNNPAVTEPGTGEFSIDTVSGNNITGSVLIDNEVSEEMAEFNYSCSPLVF